VPIERKTGSMIGLPGGNHGIAGISLSLYTLATLSMTFAGFSAVVIVLCQTIGREISGFHVVLMRLYIEAGLWAAGFCMLRRTNCQSLQSGEQRAPSSR
jgi:hypothetical protein